MKGEWQPIETAPKEYGCLILLFGNGPSIHGSCYVGSWFEVGGKECWHVIHAGEVHPTHWQPLPEPPQ